MNSTNPKPLKPGGHTFTLEVTLGIGTSGVRAGGWQETDGSRPSARKGESNKSEDIKWYTLW